MLIKEHQRQPLKRDLKIGLFLLGVLALFFGNYIISVPISAFAAIFSIIFFILFSSLYLLQGNPTLSKVLQLEFEMLPSRTWGIPIGLWLLTMVYALFTKQLNVYNVCAGLVYCVVPFLLIKPLLQKEPKLLAADVFLLLFLWLPIEFGWIPNISIPPVQGQVAIYKFIGIIIIVFLYASVRKIPIGFTYRLKGQDWWLSIQNLLMFLPFALVIGFLTGFIALSHRMPSGSELLSSFIAIFVFIALPEELLFRGVIQNLIEKRMAHVKNGQMKALIISSVIFGLAHANNPGAPFLSISFFNFGTWQVPWVYVVLASIAGFFYGWTFIKTGKITAAALVHLYVDWIWSNFLSG